MIWFKLANAWERGAAYAAAFHSRHGHLAIPATVKLDDYAVGARMRRQRKAENFTKDQVAKLDGLDELGRLEPDWNRSYRRLLAYLAAGGTLDGPANRTGLGDDPAFRPGTRLRKQDKARTDGKLTGHQSALLVALHWNAETVLVDPPGTHPAFPARTGGTALPGGDDLDGGGERYGAGHGELDT